MDNSCIAIVYGCTDPTGLNYYPGANMDNPNSPCCYVLGCTDPTASNYNPLACMDDNSCTTQLITKPLVVKPSSKRY